MFPKHLDLITSHVFGSGADETVEVGEFDAVRIDQSQVADAEVGKF